LLPAIGGNEKNSFPEAGIPAFPICMLLNWIMEVAGRDPTFLLYFSGKIRGFL
jgi:hypothetical protein